MRCSELCCDFSKCCLFFNSTHLAMAQSVARRSIQTCIVAALPAASGTSSISIRGVASRNKLRGLNRKTAQSTIKIPEFPDFSPDLTFPRSSQWFYAFSDPGWGGWSTAKLQMNTKLDPWYLYLLLTSLVWLVTTEWNGAPSPYQWFHMELPKSTSVTSMVVRRRTSVHTLANITSST